MSETSPSGVYIGLMSGTSLDGVDVAIVDFAPHPPSLLHTETRPYPAPLRHDLRDICTQPEIRLDTLYRLDASLGDFYAECVNAALATSRLPPTAVAAIGSHGQTLRHGPDASPPYTVQIGDPNRIATATGVVTIADFRRKDMAVGGQGAPLAPAFHEFLFRHAEEDRAVINIGGIANLSGLPAAADLPVTGFDTGPGNTLLDGWARRHLECDFDADGAWAREGRIIAPLLQRMLDAEAYFRLPPPKSTGTEYFSAAWLDRQINGEDAADIQATLAELTAITIARGLGHLPFLPGRAYVCGGGAHNGHLLERLGRTLPDIAIETTAALGFDPDFVEAAAFAWLARQRLEGRPGNLPSVTSAARPTILGGVYLP